MIGNAARLLVLMGCMTVTVQGADAPSPEVTVTDHGVKVSDLPGNRKLSRQEIALTCGKTAYALAFQSIQHNDKDGKPVRHEGTIAVDDRTGALGQDKGYGWYPTDTFRVFVNGVDLHATGGRIVDTRIREQGRNALVETTLVHPKASARVRLAYKPGQEGIDVQVILLPRAGTTVKTFSVRLSCYPAFFTTWNKRRGDRWVVTPKRAIEEPREPGLDMNARTWKHVVRHVDLDPAKEWRLFYYDKFFNSPNGNRKGVCGLVVRPKELRTIGLDVSDYEIVTRLTAKPGQTVMRFTLWQRNERDYGPPLANFPAIAAGIAKRLANKLLFSPTGIVGFDKTAESHALTALEKKSAKGVALREPLNGAIRAVDRFRAAPMARLLSAEAAAETAIREYRRAFWAVRRRTPHTRRILALVGRHFPHWKLDEAAARSARPFTVDKSFFWVSYRGERLSTFPATEDEMMQYDAVVFINVSVAPLRTRGQELLEQFVANGGGLMVCGGFYSYGGGLFDKSVLGEILPVRMKGLRDLKRLPAAASVVQGDNVPGLAPWRGPSTVMWLQDLDARPGSRVPLHATVEKRNRPFLVVGRYREGRVAAFAGTVHGVPPTGKPAFWDSPEWPAYLARVVGWISGDGSSPHQP